MTFKYGPQKDLRLDTWKKEPTKIGQRKTTLLGIGTHIVEKIKNTQGVHLIVWIPSKPWG